jgi:hypothetical protein
MTKIIVLLLFAIVLYCLASASYYLITKQEDGKKMARALTWRIILSMAIFLTLLAGFATGWLHPHGLNQ